VGTPVSFTATKLGVQTIVLKVSDPAGSTTVTQAVTVKDTKKPTVKLRKVKAVTLGQRTTLRGTVTDASGIKRVTLSWGDRTKSVKVHLGRRGGFTIRHRYKKAGTFTVKLTAKDRTGHSKTSRAKAHVKKNPKKRR
jgi:PKD repeat protein